MCPLLSFIYFFFLSPLITLGKEVLYVGVKLVICVYVDVLKGFFKKIRFFTNNSNYITKITYNRQARGSGIFWTDEPVSLTSCTFCRSATMFVRSFCSFSSASFSLTSVLLLFSSTALALASALL